MSSDLLNTAVTGLRVTQSALSTTGHNIANASVEGYSRQIVQTETNPATPQGGFYVGNGANVAAIERRVNEFLVKQLRTDTMLYNELDVFQDNISQLDSLLSDGATGLSGAFESFFASLQNGADDPTSVPARQLIISETENLSDRFNTIYERLLTIGQGIDTSLKTAASEVNSIVSSIADLNNKVADAIGAGNGQPNDLFDQRDQALKELAKYISFQTYEQNAGEINILVANGQNLVVGAEGREIAIVDNPSNPREKQMVFLGESTQQAQDTSSIGGEMGGLFRFRDEVLDHTFNELGRIAIVMAETFNRTNATGIDLNNNFGTDMFTDVNDRETSLNRVIASSGNLPPNDRVLRVDVSEPSDLTLSDYQLEMVNDGVYSIRRLDDNVEVARNLLPSSFPVTVEFDGLELVFERGTFQGGDQFLIQAVRDGARDFDAELVNSSELAFAFPFSTGASLSNQGQAQISAGDVLSLTDNNGNMLPLFSTPGVMAPPMVVRFLSENSYEILDNSDPGNPVALNPPISNQRYYPGVNNQLFPTDPGETQVLMDGASTGLGAGVVAVTVPPGTLPLVNGYPSEVLSFTTAESTPGLSPTVVSALTTANASARMTATSLNAIPGVSVSASTYVELSNTVSLSGAAPLQITLQGQNLIPYSGGVPAPGIPSPSLSEADFNDYLVEQINSNTSLQTAGIYARAALDSVSGLEQVRIYSSFGDDIEVTLSSAAGSLDVGDGSNPEVTLAGGGAGVEAVTVGGQIDMRLADGVTLSTTPSPSNLFGSAQSSYTGIQASIRGNPQAGDTFTLDFNQDASSDNRNALALANLESTRIMSGGDLTFSDSYGAVVEGIGIETSSARINRDAAEKVLEQSENLRNSVSAVNLDEEAADLIRFEQMYAANAQVISVARDLFDRLISAF